MQRIRASRPLAALAGLLLVLNTGCTSIPALRLPEASAEMTGTRLPPIAGRFSLTGEALIRPVQGRFELIPVHQPGLVRPLLTEPETLQPGSQIWLSDPLGVIRGGLLRRAQPAQIGHWQLLTGDGDPVAQDQLEAFAADGLGLRPEAFVPLGSLLDKLGGRLLSSPGSSRGFDASAPKTSASNSIGAAVETQRGALRLRLVADRE